jgi:hypothetical protein
MRPPCLPQTVTPRIAMFLQRSPVHLAIAMHLSRFTLPGLSCVLILEALQAAFPLPADLPMLHVLTCVGITPTLL